MAAPAKTGIDYFQADVDMFQDRKIKRLLRSAGGKGVTIYLYLLTEIYRDKGYYYAWDQHSAFDISDDLNFKESVVEETVKACCSIGLFNEALYSAKSILTSESIQTRWQKIVTDANRKITEVEATYKISDGKPEFLSKETELPKQETPNKSQKTPQRKGKESKEYQSKEKQTKLACVPDPEREDTSPRITSKQIESIYEAYPRKVGRKKALQNIEQALKDLQKHDDVYDPYEFLIKRTRQFANSPKGQAGKYCPHPSTWYHQARYLDDPQEWEIEQQPEPNGGYNANGQPSRGDRRVAQLTETEF